MVNLKSPKFWLPTAFCAVAAGGAFFLLREREPSESDVWEFVHADTPHEQGMHGGGPAKASPEAIASSRQRLAEFNRAIEADPTNKRLIIERINLAIAVDPPFAIRECQRILHQDPRNHFALQHIASAYLEGGDLDKSLHYAVLTSQQKETPDTRNVIAQVFYRRGLLDKAMLHYERTLAMDPGNEHALAAVAMIKEAQRRKK